MKRLLLFLLCAATLSAQQPATPPIVVVSPDGKPTAVPFPTPALPATDCHPSSGALFPLGDTVVTCGASTTFPVTVLPPPPSLFDWPSQVSVLGFLKVPMNSFSGTSFAYNGRGLAWLPLSHTLLLTAKANDAPVGERIAELNIPQVLGGVTTFVHPLAPFVEPTEGAYTQVVGKPSVLGAYLPVGDRLIGTHFISYDGANIQPVAQWIRPLDLADKGHVSGLLKLPIAPFPFNYNPVRFTNSHAIEIPPEWQATLGGQVGLGGCCNNISGGNSNGPAFFAWDVNSAPGTPVTPWLYYPSTQPLAVWNMQSDLWNGTMQLAGGFIDGNALVFVYTIGIGPFCYGSPTNPTHPCVDPDYPAQGGHAPPYVVRAMAFDLRVLIKNKLTPWINRPYASWTLGEFPRAPDGKPAALTGIAFDRSTRRLYVSQYKFDGTPNSGPIFPRLWVLSVKP